ncbi:hypothetical protein [Shouchella shacheensis]|uniref:hypothetical protein n=1 Tax=Shouchella shacheensis TaxID=1649580 RepID=UPI0007403A91|nr:hypothetical protein [Shouchella shacheensis]
MLFHFTQTFRSSLTKVTVMVAVVFFLSGCSFFTSSSASAPLHDEEDGMVTILFSDRNSMEEETNYYNALLDVQNQNSEVPSFILCESSDKEAVDYYGVNEYPTMLVLDGDQEKLRVEGVQKRELIYHKLSALIPTSMNS